MTDTLPRPVDETEILGECSICITILTVDLAYQLSACGHIFHRLCLRGLLRHTFHESFDKLVDLRRRRLVEMLCPNCRRTVSRQDVLSLQTQSKNLSFQYALQNVPPDAQFQFTIYVLRSRRYMLYQKQTPGDDLQLNNFCPKKDEKFFSIDVGILVPDPHATFVVRLEKNFPREWSLITEKMYPPDALMSLEKDAADEKSQQLKIDAGWRVEATRQCDHEMRFNAQRDTWEEVPDSHVPVTTPEVLEASSASFSPELSSPSELFVSSSTTGEPAASTASRIISRRTETLTPPVLSETRTFSTDTVARRPYDLPSSYHEASPAEYRRNVFSFPGTLATTVAASPREPRPGMSRDPHRTGATTVETPRTDNGGGKRKKWTEKIIDKQKRLRHKFEKVEKKLKANVEQIYKDTDTLFKNMIEWKRMDVELHGTEGKSGKFYTQLKKNKRGLYDSIQGLSKCLEEEISED